MAMTKVANELKKAYYKVWRKNNKNKVKQYNESYWERKAAQNAQDEQKHGQEEK